MASTAITRSTAAAGAVGLCGASLFGASAAVAGPEDCDYPGSTEVVPGVCQVVITADGVVTFPAMLNKVSAVIVGAGGGGYVNLNNAGPYGGGGGEVIYVDNVVLGTPITVDVGEGGIAGNADVLAGDGEDTLFGAATAGGGFAPVPDDPSDVANSDFSGGVSGNGHTGALAGGGAAGDASSSTDPGPGYVLSAVPGVDPALFPASADGGVEYGGGGIGDSDSGLSSLTPLAVNSGAGGGAYTNHESDLPFGGAQPGADGVVILRYSAQPALAATGSDATGALMLGAAAAVGGAALVAAANTSRRRRNAS